MTQEGGGTKNAGRELLVQRLTQKQVKPVSGRARTLKRSQSLGLIKQAEGGVGWL